MYTNRMLQALRKDRLIRPTSNALVVLDWRRLRDVGDSSERYLHHAV